MIEVFTSPEGRAVCSPGSAISCPAGVIYPGSRSNDGLPAGFAGVVSIRSGEAASPVRRSTLGVDRLGGALLKSTGFCDFGFVADAEVFIR